MDIWTGVFTDNCQTVEFLKETKCMFIMRGLPGSGKSTLAHQLMETYTDSIICSADDHFKQADGSYNFYEAELKNAHESCQWRAKSACCKNRNVVIIDNTNVKAWEMKAYLEIANSHGYLVYTVQPNTPWRRNVNELAKRNKHHVAVSILQRKLSAFENVLPIYYAWILTGKESENLITTAQQFLKMCLEVRRVVDELRDHIPQTALKEMKDHLYFTRQHFSSSIHNMHCTAMFDHDTSRYQPSGRALSYSTLVKDVMGTVDKLNVTGFVITTNSFCAKVKLNEQQLKIFYRDSDDGGGNSASASGATNCGGRAVNSWRTRHDSYPAGFRQTRHASDISDLNSRFTSLNLSSLEAPLPKGTRAHITLGCRVGVPPVTAGNELLMISKLWAASSYKWKQKCDCFEVTYYGNGMFFVDLNKPIQVTTIFAGTEVKIPYMISYNVRKQN
ncbi:2',3'-cyclic-nucleotide 3'-phosphodiesterase-like [Tubulanus polymorphus]|uniref:2',3'-cyclic-nucleotide 3'-phosphodiesterase-like n=1 Tax=Tubulanus polymorphus TaxID=672921 RepID=UPI003DA31504